MAETFRRIRPTPTEAYLGNPHKGCCTFQGLNGGPLFPGTTWSEEGPLEIPPATQAVTAGYLPCTVAYCRWFWRVMEPAQGQYDFRMIERALQACQERGQTLAVRLMAFGSWKQPQVPDWYAQSYPMIPFTYGGGEFLIPDLDSSEYLEHWGGFVREFGRRYDGHPFLESIDITYI
ncbi:MAG TPA: beta-galactosidase, partial [Chthonomonadaceae bacterium]|nr:beta-galactosidase [Chthonomonadaceae bacterium]